MKLTDALVSYGLVDRPSWEAEDARDHQHMLWLNELRTLEHAARRPIRQARPNDQVARIRSARIDWLRMTLANAGVVYYDLHSST